MQQSNNRAQKWTRETLLEYLKKYDISFQEVIHEAVFTMAESAALGITLSGSRCKNLLVRDKKRAHRFLVVTEPDANIDLGALGHALGVGRLSLCPPEEMQNILHIAPGALSPLALVADTEAKKIRLIMDESLHVNPKFLFHPLVNTSTIAISSDDLRNFVKYTGHAMEYMQIPARAPSIDGK